MTKMKLAPSEPTEEMIQAGRSQFTHTPENHYKAMLADCQEVNSEPVIKVTNNGAQLSLTKPDGTYWDMSKHIGQLFYLTHQPDRVEELEALVKHRYSEGYEAASIEWLSKVQELEAKLKVAETVTKANLFAEIISRVESTLIVENESQEQLIKAIISRVVDLQKSHKAIEALKQIGG